MSGVRIGVDIGGTKIDAVVVDENAEVLGRHRIAVRKGHQGVVDAAVEAVATLTAEAGISVTDALSIGVGIPGTVTDGVVHHAQNLDVHELDLASALREAWGRDVFVENDVTAAAVGAWQIVAPERRSVAYLNLGTGLAAGIILDGKLWRGAYGAAGEIGYISVDPRGPEDPEGNPGGLETYASGSGIVLQWGADGSDARAIMAAAAKGDPAAEAIRDRLYFGVASAIRVLVLAYDVEEVIIGGGLTGLGDSLLDGTTAVLDDWSSKSAFLNSLKLTERTRMLEGYRPVAAIGAALLGVDNG
ncbi:ROK family protein [Demequina sp. B12]|uniref:ROK family protein n=1 Tax=Demequina sp. B12 TaxID=2992757 RepID=UPI00237ABB96|nr:ROK family protein [Demequina sp. B12]MDE0572532.1 ROK family protein [Demequina sp. B12]